jgi:antirestriction protein
MLDNVPESLKDYFDFERYADELFRYDYDFQDGYVFRSY